MLQKLIIFLDLDGVLITQWSEEQPFESCFKGYVKPFQTNGVQVLNQTLAKFDANLVLSSDWRFVLHEQTIAELFKFNKITQKPILMPYDLHLSPSERKLPNYKAKKRCREIEMYVNEYKLQRFIIFDDLDLKCFPKHFVQTTMQDGLNENHQSLIFDILSPKS